MDANANSGSAADIQAAVNTVFNAGGGNVYLPSSLPQPDKRWHWNGQTLVVPCGVSLFAPSFAGCMGHDFGFQQYVPSFIIHNDILNNRNTPDMIVLDGTGGKNGQSRISGIQTEIGDPLSSADESTSSGATGWRIKEAKNFRIDHCNIFNFSFMQMEVQAAPSPYQNDKGHSAFGLVDHCVFDAPYKDNGKNWGVAYGLDAMGNMQPKLNNWNPGVQKYAGKYQAFPDVALVYAEDCTFRRMRHALDNANGGMIVPRYCLFDHIADEIRLDGGGNSLFNTGEVCQHPYWAGGLYPGLMVESYNNVFTNIGGDAPSGNMHRNCPLHPNQPHDMFANVLRGSSGLFFGNTYYNPEPAPGYKSVLVELREESTDPNGQIGIIKETYIWDEDGRVTNEFMLVKVDAGSYHTPTLNVDYFLRKPNLAQDGWDYVPYVYPHPLTLDGAPYNLTVQANIVTHVVVDGMSGQTPFPLELAEGTHQVSVDENVEAI